MNLNLHAIVRPAITSANSDTPIAYSASTGNTVAAGGKQMPTYAAPVPIMGQVQPASGSQLRKYNFLQAAGTYRSVHLYGAIEGILRSLQKGGDLLVFADPSLGGLAATWLVSKVDETWGPGWCRVIVTLQLDPNNPK